MNVSTLLLLGLDDTKIISLFGSCFNILLGSQLKFLLFRLFIHI